jgi:hypothetical protein
MGHFLRFGKMANKPHGIKMAAEVLLPVHFIATKMKYYFNDSFTLFQL